MVETWLIAGSRSANPGKSAISGGSVLGCALCPSNPVSRSLNVGAVADFAHLAIIDYINATARLLLHDLLDRRSYPPLKGGTIKRLAAIEGR
jgi:hypothetical protein